MMRTAQKLLSLTAVCFFSCPLAADITVDSSSTGSVYKVDDKRIIFPGGDNKDTKTNAPQLTISVKDFPGIAPYRDQLLTVGIPLPSKVFEIPESATTLTMTARGRAAGNIFPRIRVSISTQDRRKHLIFEGYWQTTSIETYSWPVPEAAKGKDCSLLIEMLNPGLVEEQRTWYFLRANIY